MRPWKPKRRVVAARRGAYALVDARAGDRCEMCGAHAPVGAREHSHRSHAGIGGSPASLRASNLLLSCAGPVGCNRLLSDLATFAVAGRAHGWLIGRGADPTTTPVLLFEHGWVTLNDEGTYTPTKETL
jgi:hypothetical protein